MTNEWIKFDDDNYHTNRMNPQALLNARRFFRLNEKAVKLLGSPKAVRFLFDANQNRIGIRAEDASQPHAYQLVPEKRGTTSFIRGNAFCRRFGIKPEFTIAFQGIRMDQDGTLILDLNTAKRKAM